MTFNTGETSEELKEMYNPEGSTLRKAQMRMLEMLRFIDEVCRKENIHYYIEGGTMLGAVRHGGFIPWDDDADIVISAEGMKRFKEYMKNNPHPQYVLQDHESDPHYYGFWSVLRDTKSEYIQDSPVHNTRKYRGCQVDMFVQERYAAPKLHFIAAGITFLNQKWFIGRCNPIASAIYHIQKYVVHPTFRLLAKCFGKKDMCMYSWGIIFREVVPAKYVFGPTSGINFEGVELQGIENREGYLRHQFGDTYNELPPKESRLGHKTKVIFYD